MFLRLFASLRHIYDMVGGVLLFPALHSTRLYWDLQLVLVGVANTRIRCLFCWLSRPGLCKLFWKRQVVNILGFVDHVSVVTEAQIDTTETNEHN
jgi:hypothetical protein